MNEWINEWMNGVWAICEHEQFSTRPHASTEVKKASQKKKTMFHRADGGFVVGNSVHCGNVALFHFVSLSFIFLFHQITLYHFRYPFIDLTQSFIQEKTGTISQLRIKCVAYVKYLLFNFVQPQLHLNDYGMRACYVRCTYVCKANSYTHNTVTI